MRGLFGLLRGDGKVKKPIPVRGKLLNNYYNQLVTPVVEVKLSGRFLSIFLPTRGNSNYHCEPRHDRLALVKKRKLEAERKAQ